MSKAQGLTVAQAALLCGVAKSTVLTWISRGHIKRGRGGAIDQAELLAWWDRRDTKRIRRSHRRPEM